MSHNIISPKKLIEVALPLDAINAAAAREKSIRHGHPSTLHLWWARRPLAAARAVIFSQLVHDPEDLWRCQNPGVEPNAQVKGHWTKARARLFSLIEELVLWENTTNEDVLNRAREEIRKSWRETCELNRNHPQAAELFDPERMPGLHDPFAGGGTIPLEAQRLGLEAYASDLNPVAVLINKAMIEIPPKFAGRPPVNPESRGKKSGKLGFEESWKGAAGLAEDVRYYGQWMRDEAFKRIGHLYPPVEITREMVAERPDLKPYEGEKLTVIAWLWARTVKSPNPAFSHVDVPLVNTFVLSSKEGKEAYVEPVLGASAYEFKVKTGIWPAAAATGTKAGRGSFKCLMTQVPINTATIRESGRKNRLSTRLLAIVVEGRTGKLFLSPTLSQESAAHSVEPQWEPSVEFFPQALGFRVGSYGLTKWSELFTRRQLEALSTFASLVAEVADKVNEDAEGTAEAGDSSRSIAVATYLGLAVGRAADYWSGNATWEPGGTFIGHTFTKHAVPMVWDFAEANPFSNSSGNWVDTALQWIPRVVELLPAQSSAEVHQIPAQEQTLSMQRFVSTDPPYYDNVGYADLSDYFYVWLRRSLRSFFPQLFSTIATPKASELVATAARHGGRREAEAFFLEGMTSVFRNISSISNATSPVTIYYAFKQSDSVGDDVGSTGWETFLAAVCRAGFTITGTWPIRTERPGRTRDIGSNALASSIVLVCRQRLSGYRAVSRRDFVRELSAVLPRALDAMMTHVDNASQPVAPVDLSQAIIGPGMAVFSKYDAVLEADGTPMSVKTALQLINRFLAEDDFDADTQFCLHWFEQYGWDSGKFGEADTLARAKGTSVDGVKNAGVLHAAGGNVRLLKWAEYPTEWDPQSDQRLPVWEVLHQLIRVFSTEGESGAAAVYAAVQGKAEAARQLAYRLYTLCERKNWADDARAYNEVVTSWSAIETAAAQSPAASQRTLFDD